MDKKTIQKLRKRWVSWLVFLITSAFMVPYLFLSGIESVKGAFLFWIVFALAAIYSTIRICTYWSDTDESS